MNWHNKAEVLEAVKEDGSNLRYASEALRNDKEVVLEAMKEHVGAFQYTSEALRNDKEVILTAVSKWGGAFQYASEALRNNRKFVLEVVKENWVALRYASEALRNDKEFMLVAMKQHVEALRWASKELRNDPEFLLEARGKPKKISLDDLFATVNPLNKDIFTDIKYTKSNSMILKFEGFDSTGNKCEHIELVSGIVEARERIYEIYDKDTIEFKLEPGVIRFKKKDSGLTLASLFVNKK